MTTNHKAISLIGGDDLFINVQLTDQNRQPYTIDTLDYVKWLLHDAEGQIVPIDYVINTIDSAAGKITIWLPHTETTRLAGGMYTEWLRISCNNIVSTLLKGPITVTADPWRATVADIAPFAAHHVMAEVVVMLDEKERIRRRAVTADNEIERRGPARVLPLRMR